MHPLFFAKCQYRMLGHSRCAYTKVPSHPHRLSKDRTRKGAVSVLSFYTEQFVHHFVYKGRLLIDRFVLKG
jgi:hypothetical protein